MFEAKCRERCSRKLFSFFEVGHEFSIGHLNGGFFLTYIFLSSPNFTEGIVICEYWYRLYTKAFCKNLVALFQQQNSATSRICEKVTQLHAQLWLLSSGSVRVARTVQLLLSRVLSVQLLKIVSNIQKHFEFRTKKNEFFDNFYVLDGFSNSIVSMFK